MNIFSQNQSKQLFEQLDGIHTKDSIMAGDDDTPSNPTSAKTTNKHKPKPKKHRTLWLSDIHLGTKDCKAEFLLTFLKANQCDTLYLVGDIIDGWRLKSSMYWPQQHTNVIRRILTLAKRDTKVFYITGNHDEFLRRYSHMALEMGNIQLQDEAEHITADGRRLLVIHGDQFDGVTTCHKWIAHLGDKGYDFLIFLNRHYNRFRASFGYGYWSLSKFIKHKVKSAVSFIFEFEKAVAIECEKRGFDGVICGHIHHAEIKPLNKVTYHNCGDWVESCTALAEDENGNISIINWVEEMNYSGSHEISKLSS